MPLRREPKINRAQVGGAATSPAAQLTSVPAATAQVASLAFAYQRQAVSAGLAIFLTGLSGAGKTTIARELGTRFAALGHRVTLLDGDDLRARVSPDLGFSSSDRQANLRRAGMIAAEVVKHGVIAVCSFIAPYEQSRQEIRESVEEYGRFFLVHLATPLEECERRDPKGLYLKARAGTIASFTGVSDVYEIPKCSDLTVDTSGLTAAESADRILRGLVVTGLPPALWLAAGLRLSHGSVANSISLNPRRPQGMSYRLALFHSVFETTAKRRVTLAEVSRAVGTERHAIETTVRFITGQSFREFQQGLLLERSNTLLQQGKPIKEVAFELGFGSPQSFHRFVRRASGKTPTSLRESA